MAINRKGDYTTPRTHEVIVGVGPRAVGAPGRERLVHLAEDVALQLAARHLGRRLHRRYRLRADGQVTGTLPSNVPGSPPGNYSVPYYALTPGTPYDPAKGMCYTERPGYHQGYHGIEDVRDQADVEPLDGAHRLRLEPLARGLRRARRRGRPDPDGRAAPNIDGGDVGLASGAVKGGSYVLQPRYQVTAARGGRVAVDFDLGASYLLREGFGTVWSRTTTGGFRDPLGSSKNLLLGYPKHPAARYPAVSVLDVRVGKRQRLGKVTLNFDLDVFNLFNSATILSRQTMANSARVHEGRGDHAAAHHAVRPEGAVLTGAAAVVTCPADPVPSLAPAV